MLIVEVVSSGTRWFLRGTTWSADRARATQFASSEQARAALDTARKFMKPKLYKAAQVVPA